MRILFFSDTKLIFTKKIFIVMDLNSDYQRENRMILTKDSNISYVHKGIMYIFFYLNNTLHAMKIPELPNYDIFRESFSQTFNIENRPFLLIKTDNGESVLLKLKEENDVIRFDVIEKPVGDSNFEVQMTY